MQNFKLFEVGGCVRDELMGVDCKDIDCTVVCNQTNLSAEKAFELLVADLTEEGFTIFQKHPDFFTIRAKFPKNHKFEGLVADFVLARKEFYDGVNRQPIKVEIGTLEDDLARRDFTVNAIAKCVETGEIIDPFNGIRDISVKMLRTTRGTKSVLEQDSLRVFRALRFCITKDFTLGTVLYLTICDFDVEKFEMCSNERIREELFKMFAKDTLKSLKLLAQFPKIQEYIFKNNLLWLKPTIESK